METAPAKRSRVPEFLNVPWNIKDVAVFGLAWIGIQVALFILLGILAPVVPWLGSFLASAQSGENITAVFALDLIDAAVGIGVITLYLHKYGVGWKTLGWRRVSLLKTIGYLVAILAFFIVVANVLLMLVSVLVPGFNPNEAQNNEFIGAANTHTNLALIALVLLPPILEETIFRGFVFPAISKRTGVVWGAILSSALFGLVHFQANITVYTFVLGLLLCFMYVRLKSIVPGILLHMVNNYLAFLAFTGK